MANHEHWEPDIRKAFDQLKETNGNLQRQVDDIARQQRENAVSPLDLVAEVFTLGNDIGRSLKR